MSNLHKLMSKEEKLKELFALFTASTKYEKKQIYDSSSQHFFEQENLSDTYDLSQEKKEYAIDILRSSLQFLVNNGFKISKDLEEITTEELEKLFL